MTPQLMTFGQQTFYAEIKKTHKSEIKASDTILLHGRLTTVCNSDIRKGSELLIHGYGFGRERGMVEKVIIYRATAKGWAEA